MGELCSVDHIINVLWLSNKQESVCLIVPKMTLLWNVTVLSWVFYINNAVFMMTVLVLTASPQRGTICFRNYGLLMRSATFSLRLTHRAVRRVPLWAVSPSGLQIKDWLLRVLFLCDFKADLWK